MDDERWAMAYESDLTRSTVPAGITVPIGGSIVVGRQGDLPLGVEIYDRGVSREAAVVTATEHGWQIEMRNLNGAVLHPWGQAPVLAGRHSTLSWPRIAVRILNGSKPGSTQPGGRRRAGAEPEPSDTVQHWLLFESGGLDVTPTGPQVHRSGATSTFAPREPVPLTDRQLEALKLVFADHLRWPPKQTAEPLLLTTAARRMGITANGVQNLLDKAIARARQHGLHGPVGRTDPEYLYVLVRAGYLTLPPNRMHRRRLL